MTDSTDMGQLFANLASSAQSGQFMIEDGTAKKCADRCNSYIGTLQDSMRYAKDLVRMNSFGNLNSVNMFTNKIHNLGSDESAGSGSYANAIKERIDALQKLADMFTKAGEAFTHADAATQAKIRQAAGNLNG